jgi:hypothetical protein
MVLRPRLLVNAAYYSRSMVDRRSDSLVESLVVHLPFIGLVGFVCWGKASSVVSFPLYIPRYRHSSLR